MNSSVQKIDYHTVDLAKFFFCICILFRHTGAYHEIPASWYFQHMLFCLAVPFFFVTSGFFLGRKIWNADIRNLPQIASGYVKRLLYPYIVFTLINSIFAARDLLINGESIKWTLLRLARAALFYPYGALWYVWASIIGCILLCWFIKINKLKLAMFLGILGYVFALLCNSYYFLIEGTLFQHFVDIYLKITTSARNGLFVGLPLLGIGICLAKIEQKLFEKKNLFFTAICFLFSAVTLFIEVCFIQNKYVADDHSLFVSQLILIPALLILLLNKKTKYLNTAQTILLRNMSTGIYFIHRPLLTIIRYIISFFDIELSGITQFIILSFLCLSICYFVFTHKKEPFYSLLK
ncbi:MAG: acyltransferase [Lachnospiraceae bacterium]|nr:acyltransferase [Lachnospiraceae bacterium]